MKTFALTDASRMSDLLCEGCDEEVLILRDGHAVALLVPFDDNDAEWYARECDPAFLESIARARRQVAAGDTVSHEDLKRELGVD